MTGGIDPRVTMVMPVFDGMPWLPEAVESVRRQLSPEAVQLVVCDGGSTDGSREWLAEHAPWATLRFEADAGQADALAQGFDRARGEILGWLNADDVLEHRALERVVEAFDLHPDAVGVSGGCTLIDGDGAQIGEVRRLRDASLRGLLATNINLPQPATFFRRSAYRAAGGVDRRLHYAMDVDLWLRLAARGEIVLVPETLARFRIHPSSKTQRAERATLREDWWVRRRHGMRVPSRVAWTIFKQTYLRPIRERFVR